MSRRFRFHPILRRRLPVNSTISHHPLDSTITDLLPMEKKDEGFEIFPTTGEVGKSPSVPVP